MEYKHLLYALPPFLGLILSTALSGLVLARLKRTPVHWGFAAAMAALAVAQTGNAFSLLAESPQQLLGWRRVAVAGEILMPMGSLLFSLTYARSNAEALLREWRGWLWAVGLLSAVFLGFVGSDKFFMLTPGGTETGYIALGPIGLIYACVYIVAQVLILANLEQTFRHADETTRWSVKFPIFGLGLLCVYFTYQTSVLLLYRAWTFGFAWVSGVVSVVACVLIGYGLMRRPLRDVQIYVSRRVLSDSFTFLIVGGVLLATGLIAEVIRYSGIEGQASLSTLFVIVTLLGLALSLSSHNVRLGIGRFAERHFFPYKYDYRIRWAEMTEAVGFQGTPEQVAKRVSHVVRGIWGPRSISIWVLSEIEGDMWVKILSHPVSDLLQRINVSRDVIAWMHTQNDPLVLINLSKDKMPPPSFLGTLNLLGAVLFIPLKADGKVLGWMTLGPIANRALYDQQDVDLLRSIAGQVADRLQHLLLAEKLAMGREMEAFYEYSTFFLHDLKNFTATLSLVIQNAERRGSDPTFQAAAMNTVGATVKKMTALIGTLTALSRDPHPKPVSLDLNLLVDEVIKGFESAGTTLLRESASLPLVDVDASQMQQVLLNLILNAQEAVGADGRIVVRTEVLGSSVRLIVEDDGCGMDRATVAGLFRPFRTLKSKGLGIGLYQCRKIVQAHQGTLDVESESGKGTRFLISLPVRREGKVEAHG